MRRRPRIDLGRDSGQQQQSARDDEIRERKRQRWATVNKNRPAEENPFLAAIKPNHDSYGEPGEGTEELRARLESLEFGNYPGYFNYRNKAATIVQQANSKPAEDKTGSSATDSSSLEDGLTDERLRLMKEEWFRGRNVLDIGCNRGHVTYAIAKVFRPKFILGIDIDLKMINMANRDLHHHLESDIIKANIEHRIKRAYQLTMDTKGQGDNKQEEEEGAGAGDSDKQERQVPRVYAEDEQHFPLSTYVNRGPMVVPVSSSQTRMSNCDSVGESEERPSGEQEHSADNNPATAGVEFTPALFPNRILFVEHNYVLSRDELVDKQTAHFDTIVCLSVTKWIHLNYRDDGLKRFFRRMYRHLNEGGLLVLEAQPFDNYHRKKKLSERLRANFNSIKFKPDQFDDFLLGEQVGFRRIIFSTTTEHECAGFKRPMKVFLK